jgi:hypothetical protein
MICNYMNKKRGGGNKIKKFFKIVFPREYYIFKDKIEGFFLNLFNY